MNWSDLPSLTSLRAFAAVAETKSYSRAGAGLNVSHAAISQQVRALEARLGVTLVVREGRTIKLTDAGARLASNLEKGLTAIRQGIEALTDADLARPVQVTTSPAFAASWLMPRIVDFRQRHPGITLMLSATAEVLSLSPGGVDIAIRYGTGSWPGLTARPLLLPDMIVVGSPALIGNRDPNDPETLLGLHWLQELGTNEVAGWMERHGITIRRPAMVTHMPGNLILEAVRHGDGVTFTARCFVEEDIKSGRLVVLSSERGVGGYYVVTHGGPLRPHARAFLKWLRQQAAKVS
jgi:LysR family transcriptional regulator, glycine cleavage system transcriptional activator